jgi:succinate-semialdehyde dehydrogenase/glutarate-semialdehyde dehydrogenase
MRIMREEIFGPVLPIVTFDSEEEAVELANDSEFGLGASVWSRDRPRAERIARRMESGMVWINDHMYSHGTIQCAWGGTKHSGVGRSHSKLGFLECVEPKQVIWGPAGVGALWWHPYDASLGRTMREAARLLYGRDEDKLGALRRGARPFARRLRQALTGPRER